MNNIDLISSIVTFDNVFKILLLVVLVGYLFFSLFLYLRLRILALTLQTPYANVIRYTGFLNLIATLVIFVVLGLLVWLV